MNDGNYYFTARINVELSQTPAAFVGALAVFENTIDRAWITAGRVALFKSMLQMII